MNMCNKKEAKCFTSCFWTDMCHHVNFDLFIFIDINIYQTGEVAYLVLVRHPPVVDNNKMVMMTPGGDMHGVKVNNLVTKDNKII